MHVNSEIGMVMHVKIVRGFKYELGQCLLLVPLCSVAVFVSLHT